MVKCPMIGINNGLGIMCKEFSYDKSSGLCLFDMEFKVLDSDSESEEISEGNLVITKSTKLIDESYANDKVYFNLDFHPTVNEYSKIIVKLNEEKYSLLFERGYFYGFIMNISKNEALFSHIINNFITLA